MSQVNRLQSLDLILEDVSAETNLAINALEQYSSTGDKKPLKKALSHIQKLKGVFTLLEMAGAERLLLDAMRLIKTLPKLKPENRKRLLGVITTALARLMRYGEHISQKPYDMPQLLLPSINELRASANVPILSESIFFGPDGSKQRKNRQKVFVTSEESAARSRHFRQMYQIGLIEVIRQTNLVGGLKMMQKAIGKLDEECPRPHSPNLWWITIALLQAYADNTLSLTKTRLKLFSRLDRQIRKVENKSENLLEDNKLEIRLLTKELLYLVSISDSKDPAVLEVKQHFDLEDGLTDKMLREESEALRGPSDQDYQSIAEALLTEISSIEGTLRNSRAEKISRDDLMLAKKQMVNLNNLLKILQVDEEAVRLTVAIDLVDKALTENEELIEKDLNILFIVLETLAKSVEESDILRGAGRKQLNREKLSKAEAQFLKQTETSVKKLIATVTKFVKANHETRVLAPLVGLLDEISDGFDKLKVKPAKPIIQGCQDYVQNHLLKSPKKVDQDSLNLFADIIGSLEFYLETLAFTTQPSERILQFADNSLAELNRRFQGKIKAE